jgi:UDP-galactopyranose mutase
MADRVCPQWIVVGAGFTGATAARQLAERCGLAVLVIDRRSHLAGNAYDFRDETGALIQQYGPHIFHTNSRRVVDFLSRFTNWRTYRHRVMALVDGQFVPLPFGFRAIDQLFDTSSAARLKSKLIRSYGLGSRVPVFKLANTTDADLYELGQFVLEKVFRGYTRKQWGCEPEALDPSVMGRVPIVVSDDDEYFQDSFQAMPRDGYAALFQRLLDHPNISVLLGVAYEDLSCADRKVPIVFTGSVDAFHQFKFGPLPYRSVHFVRRNIEMGRVQPCAVLNFPSDFAFTRTTELSWITGVTGPKSVLIDEYPCAYELGINEPLYPIPAPCSGSLAQAYRRECKQLRENVWFAGRLGDYKYYNMDQACASALSLVEKEIMPFLKTH